MEGKMKDPDLARIVNDVNRQWQDLFDSLQDLAEWLHERGYDPDLKILCDDVPLYLGKKG